METTEKILEKLAKLKALYEDAKLKNENEANSAAAAMQRLMIKYNLSMEDVDGVDLNKNENIIHEMVSGVSFKYIGGRWELELLKVLCEFNFCKVFIVGTGKSIARLMLVGKKDNIENVKWLKNFLQTVFVDLSNKRWLEYKHAEFSLAVSKDKFQRSYLMGCADGLRVKLLIEKIKLQRRKRGQAVSENKVTALIVRSNNEINDYVSKAFGSIGTKRSRQTYMNDARNIGKQDGKNVNIGKPVGVKKNTELL